MNSYSSHTETEKKQVMNNDIGVMCFSGVLSIGATQKGDSNYNGECWALFEEGKKSICKRSVVNSTNNSFVK